MGPGTPPRVRIGIAGWALDKSVQPLFPPGRSHLARYAGIFPMVEVNSSFYRPHRPDTWRRWGDSVPEEFRFAAKVPREITHVRRLRAFREPLEKFLSEVICLGDRLGPLLVQLPPSLAFEPGAVGAFLAGFRGLHDGAVALEPRHPTWFAEGAEDLLRRHRVARAAADPAVVPAASLPGGWDGLVYRRLHGSPEMYRSPYTPEALSAVADAMAGEAERAETWCVLDNTALGHAIPDALRLLALAHAPAGGTFPFI